MFQKLLLRALASKGQVVDSDKLAYILESALPKDAADAKESIAKLLPLLEERLTEFSACKDDVAKMAMIASLQSEYKDKVAENNNVTVDMIERNVPYIAELLHTSDDLESLL